MNGYLWILIAACVGSALNAGTVLARDAAGAASRRAATLSLAACFWAACEIAWNTAADPATALFLVKLSAPGWIFIGPMSTHVFLEATGSNRGGRRRLLHAGYAAGALLLGLAISYPIVPPARGPDLRRKRRWTGQHLRLHASQTFPVSSAGRAMGSF